MTPNSLRAMLMSMVLVVQIATVVVVVTGMRQDTADQFALNARSELDLLAETVTDRTQRFLAPAENAVRMTRNLIDMQVLDVSNDEVLSGFFRAQMQASDAITAMYVGRPDGSLLRVERDAAGLRATAKPAPAHRQPAVVTRHADNASSAHSWQEPAYTVDPRSRPWYLMAHRSRSLVWTGAYPFMESRLPGISAAQRLALPNGKPAGVVGVDVDIQSLSAFIATVPNTTSGTAVIVDERRHAVAFSDFGQLKNSLQPASLPTFDSLAGQPLKTLLQRIDGLAAPASELPDGFTTVSVDGREHLGLVREFSLSDGRVNWLLMVQSPTDEYSGGMLHTIMARLRTLIATILIPGVLAMFAIFRLTAPVYAMHESATIDSLTGALNRTEFERRLTQMMRGRREHELNTSLLVMAIDLDGFKEVNDQYGHAAGDDVLRIIVSRLQRRVRKADLIGRIGGDEFMVAMRLDRESDQIDTIRQIRRSLVSEPVKTSSGRYQIGVTAGVASQEPGESLEQLVERADHALITGKTRRKNCLYVARPVASTPADPPIAAAAASRGAVAAATVAANDAAAESALAASATAEPDTKAAVNSPAFRELTPAS